MPKHPPCPAVSRLPDDERPYFLTDDEIAYAVTCYALGRSLGWIAKRLRRDRRSVKHVVQQSDVPMRSPSEATREHLIEHNAGARLDALTRNPPPGEV